MLSTRLRTAATVALLLGAVAVVGPLSAGPADAAACPGTAGVTVVVEPRELGGGSAQTCVTDGGGHTADRLLKEAGYSLDYVQRFPGFVCRIDGQPADDPCVNTPPADAYWGLWWSDGTTGKWTYSSLGAGALAVPAGGSVAMVWDGSAGTVAPQASPTVHPTPTPTPSPTKRPSPTAAPSSSAPPPTSAAASSTSAAPTTTKSAEPTRKPTVKPTRTARPTETPPTQEPTAEASPTATPSDLPPATTTSSEPDDGGGLPGWVPPVLVAVLLAVAAGVAVVRRRGR